MVHHEYKPPKCFPNTSLTIRPRRPLVRTDTSLDRESKAFRCIHYQLSRRCVPLHPLPAVVTLRSGAYHCIRYQLSRHCEMVHTTASVAQLSRHCETVHTTASVASCRDTPPTPVSKLSCPWDSMEAATFPHALSMGFHGGCQAATRALSTPVLRDGTPHQRR